MNHDQWEKVKTLFDEALQVRPESRHEWLARVAANNPEVLHEVEALVQAYEGAGGFLEEPAAVDPQDVLETTVHDPVDTSPPQESLRSGMRIGDYEIRREIGRGGMSVVYLAQDVHLVRLAAIKALPTITAHDQILLERQRREAQAAAAVSHQGVAMVYAFIETPHGNFIASEFIQGRTLRQEIARGSVEPARAVRIAIEIGQAVCAAHDAHIIHRDLKPENVLLTASGSIKVIDFGIARIDAFDARASTTHVLVGTPGYMAPEQAVAGVTVDQRADLYALGVILAEMLLGHHPLQSGSGSMPATLQAITGRCRESDPERRYQSARDLLNSLENASRTLNAADLEAVRPAEALCHESAMWWWQFHQGLAALVYWLMAVPAWYARELIGGATGRMLFFITLAALTLASVLRLHLWFTSRINAAELPMQFRREHMWILAADALFAISLIGSGVIVGDARMSLAVLLMCVGIGSGVVSLFIEPATARAAFSAAPR